jgi:hypothetical protein
MSTAAERAQQALVEADQSFGDTGDVMEALSWIASAAKAGLPIPPRIGVWLKQAIDAYRSGTAPSMDAAMGLGGRGRPPRRQLYERGKRQAANARMYVLQVAGATVEQAATLVARLAPDDTVNTLIDRYKRSGLGRRARRDRGAVRWHWTEIEQILAEYPDHPLPAAQAKAAIRKVYARHRI